MDPEGSLPHSQVPATCLYTEPARSSPYPPYPTSWRSILILSYHLCLGLPIGLFPSSFPTKPLLAHAFVPNISPGSKLALWTFRNMICFYGEELLAPRPTPKLEDHPLSAVRDRLLNIFAATLHIGGRYYIRNLRTRHFVVTGTHLSWKV